MKMQLIERCYLLLQRKLLGAWLWNQRETHNISEPFSKNLKNVTNAETAFWKTSQHCKDAKWMYEAATMKFLCLKLGYCLTMQHNKYCSDTKLITMIEIINTLTCWSKVKESYRTNNQTMCCLTSNDAKIHWIFESKHISVWRDGSAVKSTDCSSRGSEFKS